MIALRWTRLWALMTAAAPLVMLAGCPSDTAAAPGKVPVRATAPAVRAAPAQATAAPAPSTDKSTTVQTAAQVVKAQQLIAQAQASYRSGVENYRANHLDAARVDFDAAVDLLLTSGLDLKSDPQAADAFEQLLNAINSLEMVALKQGTGFSPKIEEAPLDAVGDLTFAPNPELTRQLKAELQTKSDLPLVINDEVAGYIGAFANSTAFRGYMAHSLARAGKYRAIIEKALADQGMPQDLFYLAVAESGFQPQALNPKSGAGGMWQFMPTGAYGLARNGYVDERFDPEKSSVAYAKYMKSVYRQLGDWYLAMAGYDWGPGYIQRAVMRTGYADFWELYRRNMLPKETKEYVPKILAAIIMAKNPAKYGLDKVVPDSAMVWDTVTVDYAIDLRLAADVTNASLPEIVALNPSLLRMTTPPDQAFDLHLPVGTRDLFTTRLKAIPESKRTSWRFHVVRSGESLDMVAASLHARPLEIGETNGLKAGETLRAGDELAVPISVASAVARPQHYLVRRGDTLINIADRFNLSVEDLRRWNHLSGGNVRAGATLKVSEPVAVGPSMRVRRVEARSSGGRALRGATQSHSAERASAKVSGSSRKHGSRAATKAPVPSSSHAAHATSRGITGSASKTKHKAAR